MPTYEYRCRKCKRRFELFHSIKDETRKRCPRCKSLADRVPSGGAGILFKGSGFYITDYRSPQYKEKAKQEKSAESGKSSDPGKSPGGKGDTGGKSSGGKDSGGKDSGGKGETGGKGGGGASKGSD